MVGDSASRGEGLKKLLQGVVGGAFGSAAKITGMTFRIERVTTTSSHASLPLLPSLLRM